MLPTDAAATITTSCKHIFHNTCFTRLVQRAMLNGANATCPVCRAAVDDNVTRQALTRSVASIRTAAALEHVTRMECLLYED